MHLFFFIFFFYFLLKIHSHFLAFHTLHNLCTFHLFIYLHIIQCTCPSVDSDQLIFTPRSAPNDGGNLHERNRTVKRYKFKFKFFINKESSIRNMHIWKNAQMTRTNKRIKQGNTRKIKIITILQLYQRESYPNICRLYINNTLVYIYIYKHESALLVIEHKYIQLLIW